MNCLQHQMKLRYQARKPNRYKKSGSFGKSLDYKGKSHKKPVFFGVLHINWKEVGDSYTWLYTDPAGINGRWVKSSLLYNREVEAPYGSSSHFGNSCQSIRAFRRQLKRWSTYLPDGLEFELVGLLIGTSIIGRIKTSSVKR